MSPAAMLPVAPPAVEVRARVLGGFEVAVRGRPLRWSDWRRVAAERLVKLLLVTPRHQLTREVAAETLWPELGPGVARGALRKALHFASRALGETAAFVCQGDTVGLNAAPLDLDLDVLEAAFAAVASAGSADPALTDEALATVADLGGRELLPDDRFEEWLAAPRERLASRWQEVALRAAARWAERNETERAHSLIARVLEGDPTDEAAHRLAMRLYSAEGRHHALRRQFELCRAALHAQLDTEPSAQTSTLFRELEHLPPSGGDRTRLAPPIVGRSRELEQAEPLIDRALSGRLSTLLLRGDAGIGKSRVLEEIIAYARAAGARVIHWQAADVTRSLAYAPLRLSLQGTMDAGRVERFPEPTRSALAMLGLGSRPALTFEDRASLVAAIVGAIGAVAGEQPLCLAVDDLPALDDSSLEVVAAALAGLPESAVLFAASVRDHEVVPPPAASLIDQIRRSGGLDIHLEALGRRDMEALVLSHHGGERLQPELDEALFDESRGNPLFCLQLFRAWRDEGLVDARAGWWRFVGGRRHVRVPDGIRNLVALRSNRLTSTTRKVLSVAAEVAPAIPYAVLRDVVGSGALDAIDEAIDAGLLVEQENAYAFAHPLFREAVRDAATGARRARTRYAIARALGGDDFEDTDGEAVGGTPSLSDQNTTLVAEHALAAVALGLDRARPLAIRSAFAAAAREKSLFNLSLAQSLLERGVEAWRSLPENQRDEHDAARALVDLATLRLGTGDEAGAMSTFREAIVAARDDQELGDAYTAMTWVPYQRGDFEAAIVLIDEAFARLPAEAQIPRSQLRARRGWCLVRLRRYDEALADLSPAVEVLDASPSRRAAMEALDYLGSLLDHVGRYRGAVARLQRSLSIALELGDSRGEALARLHLGTALARSGRGRAARPQLGRSLELARLMGDRYVEAVGHWALAELEDACGDFDAAMSCRERELALLESTGGNDHNAALAQAHVAHLARRVGDRERDLEASAAARALAKRSNDPTYAARIESALAIAAWSDLPR